VPGAVVAIGSILRLAGSLVARAGEAIFLLRSSRCESAFSPLQKRYQAVCI
jgi:hypothetical protein